MENDAVSRFQMEFNGDYDLEPMTLASNQGNIYVYDNKSCSFKVISSTKTSLQNSKDYSYMYEYFPMNNWDSRLLFMGRQTGSTPPLYWGTGKGYALLEKNKDPDSLFLAHIGLDWIWGSMNGNFSDIYKIDTLSKNLSLRRGEHFTIHEYERFLFYSIGNRVYSYNFYTHKETLAIGEADFSSLDVVPDEITYLRYVRCAYDESEYRFDKLFVGGYKNGRYTLYGFDLVSGKPVGDPIILSGEGKIKDMVYAAPTESIKPFYIYQ